MPHTFTTALGKGARKGEGASQGGSPRNYER